MPSYKYVYSSSDDDDGERPSGPLACGAGSWAPAPSLVLPLQPHLPAPSVQHGGRQQGRHSNWLRAAASARPLVCTHILLPPSLGPGRSRRAGGGDAGRTWHGCLYWLPAQGQPSGPCRLTSTHCRPVRVAIAFERARGSSHPVWQTRGKVALLGRPVRQGPRTKNSFKQQCTAGCGG